MDMKDSNCKRCLKLEQRIRELKHLLKEEKDKRCLQLEQRISALKHLLKEEKDHTNRMYEHHKHNESVREAEESRRRIVCID